MIAKGGSGKEWGAEKEHEGNFWGDWTVLCLNCAGSGGVYMTVCIYQNSLNCILKRVNITECKLYHNF